MSPSVKLGVDEVGLNLVPRVEQMRGQRQTGCNDLPGKGERVAKWMVRVKSKKC